MHHPTRPAVIAALVALAAAVAPVTSAAHADTAPGNPDAARFEGATLDLSDSWGAARACAELGSVTECYDTEAELLAAHPELALAAPTAGSLKAGARFVTAQLADCSSALRLYDGTAYAGTVLYLSTRGLVLNLSSYGFDNRTSSYRNGACAVTAFSGASGGGSVLGISANTQAASMPSGWNNVLSSVYLA